MRIGLLTRFIGAFLALVVFAPAARADEQVATAGAVTATFSFTPDGTFVGATNLRIAISRGGQVVYEGVPLVAGCTAELCAVPGGADSAVRVRDLDGDGEPEVLLDLFTGGAHCCRQTLVYAFDGAGYRVFEHDFGDVGYRLTDLDADGVVELLSADPRFAYRFGSYAASGFPVQIWRFAGDRLVDVTGSFRKRIRADADRYWRLFRHAAAHEPRGMIAAWAADRYRLGLRTSTLKTLRRLARRGDLPGIDGTSQTRFVSQLDGFLRRLGYAG